MQIYQKANPFGELRVSPEPFGSESFDTNVLRTEVLRAELLSRRAKSFKLKDSLGFTLIELLIVIVVLAILGVVAVNIFTQVLRGTNKAQVIVEVKQNGQFLSDTLERRIRQASDAQVTSDTITLTTSAGQEVIQFTPPCNNCNPKTGGKITINGASVTNTDAITGVDVTAATFSLIPVIEGSPKVVQVDITLNQGISASTRRDFQANVRLTNTYSLRTY